MRLAWYLQWRPALDCQKMTATTMIARVQNLALMQTGKHQDARPRALIRAFS